jgi:two-component system LytT family response regulator
MTKLRTLIVDDERLVRESVRRGLATIPEIEIVGECDTGAAALDAIRAQQPDFVLLDVQMPALTGLDVVRQIGPERMPPVIFITAYDEHAVRAFELNAVDYLLKPFDEHRLAVAVQRVRERIGARRTNALAEQLRALLDTRQQRWPERLVIKSGERFELVPVDSVDWIESANNYAQLYCGAKNHLLNETLSSLERRLDPVRFLRVHRRRIVNLSKVAAIHPMFGGTYELELRNGTRIGTGRQHKEAIHALIKSRGI